MPDDDHSAISGRVAKRLFTDWSTVPAIVLAVSGGPDSIALMWLAARWRRALARGPRLLAVTVDHGFFTECPPRGRRRRPPAARPAGLPRHQAENRAAGRGAHCALSFAGAAGTRPRRDPYPHRAYPRRS